MKHITAVENVQRRATKLIPRYKEHAAEIAEIAKIGPMSCAEIGPISAPRWTRSGQYRLAICRGVDPVLKVGRGDGGATYIYLYVCI